MKKALIILFFIFLLIIAAIYVLIPSKLLLSEISLVKANANATYRVLSDIDQWNKQCVLKVNENNLQHGTRIFEYANASYIITPQLSGNIGITIKYKNWKMNSSIDILSLNSDSVAVAWKLNMETGSNPIKRLTAYFDAKKLQRNNAQILDNLKCILEKSENIYGYNIAEEKVKDTLLITTRSVSNTYPETTLIYDLINSLRKYISANGATATNYPMLNVNNDNGIFRFMVAIPVNKVIPQTDKFLFKKMIPGRILVTKITGGTYSATVALKQLEIYISDKSLSSPAIPFESLVTDRSIEPDTAKWVTKIYYPIY